ncbi:MAG TPA: LPS assembly protein LptD [Xanthobacteraceae bacterium]|nr:LPS assembly protein LptD [Xanthobacteraceae bacterium]
MRKTGLTAIVGAGALALALTGQALAADMPVKAAPAPATPDWDIAFGGAIMSDYIFRGITQSNHGATGTAYFEPHYKDFYIGVAGTGIDWPSVCGTFCLNNPSAEIDLYGGWRPTVGKWSFDFGYIYYLYPNNTPPGPPNFGFTSDFQEWYAKATYAITDALSVGGSFYYSPDLLNYGKDSQYYELNAKYTLPSSYFAKDWGAYISGAYGWFNVQKGPTGFGIIIPSYQTWNAGLAFTYKVFTLDLRYSDTNLTRTGCISFWNAAPGSTSLGGWCRGDFTAKLAFDLLAATNLK